MPRFFIRQNQIEEIDGVKTVNILGDDAHHISRALRMAAGEKIEVVDMQKNLYLCELNGFFDGYVTARVIGEGKAETEPPVFIRLFLALSKGEKWKLLYKRALSAALVK